MDGQVIVGPEFRKLEEAWIEGGAAMARADARGIGMAASQADVVHRGMVHDLEADTTRAESMECARTIAAHVS